jgi:hypothetical protein
VEETLRCLDHREGLTAALGVPDQASPAVGIQGTANGRIDSCGLVLAQDVFVEFFVFLGKDDVVLQEIEELGDGAEALDLGLQLAHLLVLPVEEVAPHRVPTHAIGKADGIGGGEQLLAYEQFGRFAVVAADLIDAQIDGFLLIGVLAEPPPFSRTVSQESPLN